MDPNTALYQSRLINSNQNLRSTEKYVSSNDIIKNTSDNQYSISTVNIINNIIKGYEPYQRISNSVEFTHLVLQLRITNNGRNYQYTAPPIDAPDYYVDSIGNKVRFLLIWDRQSNGEKLAVQDILKTIDMNGKENMLGGTSSTLPPIEAGINPSMKKRLVVLRDLYFILGDPTPPLNTSNVATLNTGYGSGPCYFQKKFKVDLLKELPRKGLDLLKRFTIYNITKENDNNSKIMSGGLFYLLYTSRGLFEAEITSSLKFKN